MEWLLATFGPPRQNLCLAMISHLARISRRSYPRRRHSMGKAPESSKERPTERPPGSEQKVHNR